MPEGKKYDTSAAIRRLENVGLLPKEEAKKMKKKIKKKSMGEKMKAKFLKPISKKEHKGITNINQKKLLKEVD